MTQDTKKINPEIREALSSWNKLIFWLRDNEDEQLLLECLLYEADNAKRAVFLDRIRTRFNKVRNLRELRELEDYTGMVININMIGK